MAVRLREIDDEAGLRALLEVAVADATPEETMPPLEGPPGWTEARRAFFMEFFLPLVQGDETVIFAVTVDGVVAGFMRLKGLPGTAGKAGETGMWLGRSFRGKGVGAAAFDELVSAAARRGFTRIVADTTPRNAAALGVLRHGRARTREADGKIYAEIAIDPEYSLDSDK